MLALSSIMRTVVGVLLAQAVVCIVVVSAHAIEACDFGENVPKTRPNPEAGATEVRVGVFVFDLVDVVTKNQEFILDFLLAAEWKDPRLGEILRKSGRRKCEVPMEQVWTPSMFPVNARTMRVKTPRVLYVHANGTVEGIQHMIGTFAAHLDLTEFPRDTQKLPVTFISLKHSPDEVNVVFEGGGAEEVFSEKSWSVRPGRGYAGIYRMEIRRDQKRKDPVVLARFDYEIEVKRQTAYYLWKVFVPLYLIVFTSWAVFWIDPAQIGVQTGIGTAMMLTLIAFLFSLGNLLPKIPYLTRLDIFVYSSLVFVFLAFVEGLATCTLTAHDKGVLARRMDRWARVIFPSAYIVVVVWFWWA